MTASVSSPGVGPRGLAPGILPGNLATEEESTFLTIELNRLALLKRVGKLPNPRLENDAWTPVSQTLLAIAKRHNLPSSRLGLAKDRGRVVVLDRGA